MRLKTNKKAFALIYERNGEPCVNLACDAFEADFLWQVFPDVVPGWAYEYSSLEHGGRGRRCAGGGDKENGQQQLRSD